MNRDREALIPDWIKKNFPLDAWQRYRFLAEESDLTPETLRGWYKAGKPTVPPGFRVFLCVAVRPEDFYRYARDVSRLTFGQNFLRPTIPERLRDELGPQEWGLYASPPDPAGGLTQTELVELPGGEVPEENFSPQANIPDGNNIVTVQQDTPTESVPKRTCSECGASIDEKRVNAVVCSSKCRKKKFRTARREREAVPVP